MTKGRYVFVDNKVPHLPWFHNYGSDFWREGDAIVPVGFTSSVELGHDRTLPWAWYPGTTPAPLPPAVPIGSSSAFSAVEHFPIIPNPKIQGGFDARCFPGCVPPTGAIICSLFDFAINDCPFLLVLEVMQVALSEFDHAKFSAIAVKLLGTSVGLHFDDGNANFPPFAIAWNPKTTLVVHCGTNAPAQWISQISQASVGPTDYFLYSSIPVWHDAAARVRTALNDLGMSPLTPAILFGHSLGAAGLCNLAAQWINANPKATIRLVTSGCPKPGDVRLQNILNRVDRLHLTTREDIITRVPPSNAMKVALQHAFPFLPDALFGSFEPFPRYLYMDAGGEWTNDVYTDLPALDLVNVITGWWILGIIEAGYAHLGTFYVQRIREHCPCPELPFTPAFYVLMFGTADCFEGPLRLGGGQRPPAASAALILDGSGDLAVHYVLVGVFNMALGGKGGSENFTSNLKLNGAITSNNVGASVKLGGGEGLYNVPGAFVLAGDGSIAIRHPLIGTFNFALNGGRTEANALAAFKLGGAGSSPTSTGLFHLVFDGAGLVVLPLSPVHLVLDGSGDVGASGTPAVATACTSAATLGFGINYTYPLPTGTTHNWFTFNVTSGVTYYVKVTSSISSYPVTRVNTGADCSHLNLEFTDTSISHCSTFNKGSNTICFIDVNPILIGSGTYTIRVGIGACP